MLTLANENIILDDYYFETFLNIVLIDISDQYICINAVLTLVEEIEQS